MAQQENSAKGSNTKMADTLLECASAHTHNIRLLQQTNRDVSSLYRLAGYFRYAGEAFSSKEYAEERYELARAMLSLKMEKALAEPHGTRVRSVQAFVDGLQEHLEECDRYKRVHEASIRDRMAQGGLLK